jgi:hypothetical protein
MKNMFIRITAFIAILLCSTFSLWAQLPHSTPESRQKMKERADYGIFRRQAAALKEFGEERKKIPALQKENKETVKVFVAVDSIDSDDTTKNKFIQGYIVQQIGENTANAYELTFDRAQRKITTVKRTGESADPEAGEPKEKKTTTAAAKKPGTTAAKPAPKKKKDPDGDDEDEEEEEKEDKTPPSKEKDE